ncbi:MAG: RHS repeat-associated core domain-containing protein [Phycisphaerae bacterium]|jgi:RHS repeat-associated protein
MRSQLTDAVVSDINGMPWVYNYLYRLDGNIERKILNSINTDYAYIGDLMTQAGDANLAWNDNGQLISSDEPQATSHVWNWDGKLRSATKGSKNISLKYDPLGNRVIKNSSVNGSRKYVVDISSNLPTILLEIAPGTDGLLGTGDDVTAKTYIYADSQVLAQHNGDYTYPRYFYLHDRLGSVRLVINTAGVTQHSYTYNPFGEVLESGHESQAPSNSFMFTGQFYDSEISQYYLRARQYDPQLMRFTGRDPVEGNYEEPLTLHKYLYCATI